MDLIMPKRAMLSVYDKRLIEVLAAGLVAHGCELISSGGTAKAIAAAGIPVIDVADLTGYPAILGHRVVTLHPKVHGGILFDRDDPDHLEDMKQYEIGPIDLMVGNLYPFSSNPSIELIDIGGPAMVRAAAKNFAHVGVVTNPDMYEDLLADLGDGGLTLVRRRQWAKEAFRHTRDYDGEIVEWFEREDNPTSEMPHNYVTG